MIAIYIILIILVLILGLILIPIRVKIDYAEKERKDLKVLNKIEIYIFYFIKIKKIELKNKKEIENKNGNYKIDAIYKLLSTYIEYLKKEKQLITSKDIKKLLNSIYYEKLNIDVGINLQNPIVNAYLITIINIVLNLFIMKNQSKMKLKNTSYSTYISNNIFNLKLNCIIRFRVANTIITIIKIIVKLRKVEKKYGEKSSNRLTYGNSYDIN